MPITYTQLIPSTNHMFGAKIDPGANPVGAGVKLAAKALRWVHNEGFALSVAKLRESPDVQKRIASLMPANGKGGVLIVLAYDEWKSPDVNGFKAKAAKSVFVFGAAAAPEKAMDDYFRTPAMEAGPAPGWVLRHEFYWATSDSDFARAIVNP